jgi:phage protein D/phage baseplate assembly protein gpV
VTAIATHAPTLKVNGAPLAEQWLNELVDLRIRRALGLVGRATLRFSDPGFALSATNLFALGAEVSITLKGEGELMAGSVTGVSLEQSYSQHPELAVTVDDVAYKLTRGTTVKTYLQAKYSDVIAQLGSSAGVAVEVDTTSEVHEYLLQAGQDLAFLNSIVERVGYVWWVEGKKLLVKKAGPPKVAVRLVLNESLLDFSVRASGLRPTGLTVNGWNPDQQDAIVGKNGNPSDSPNATFVSKYVGASSPLDAAAASVADPSAGTTSEADSIASGLYEDWTSSAVVARGTCTASSYIKPSAKVEVADAGPASGTYRVSEVEHIFNSSGFFTRWVAGHRRPSALVDTLGAPSADPGFIAPGLVVAIVTNGNDPDNVGRVKIKYPGIGGAIESPWARVVALGAGNARGTVFQPEVNDEVLVGFEFGDTRRPVVIGGLFSKVNALPTSGSGFASGKVNFRRITSRKNHVIELADGDAPNEQHIMLKLGTAEHKVRLGADRFDIEVAKGKPITIKAGDAKFDISATGDVTIEGNNVTIKAKMAVKLEGLETTMKAEVKASVQGAMVEVKGSATTGVEASGPLTLKGAIVQIN